MAPTTAQTFVGSYNGKAICRIVGFACLAGFIVDLLILALPPTLNSAEWRVGFLQQMSNRSIILLFGAALLTYGSLEVRQFRKQLALASLVVGVVFLLSCVSVIRDSFTLHGMAVKNINSQAAQIQNQIETAKDKPDPAAKVTPEQLQQASKLVDNRVVSLKQGAQTSVFKTGTAIVGNLVVVGLALISLGRYGLHPRKG
ncbi:MAG: HpsJ family protein [Stenomitos frigidus ULC029]